MKQTHSEKMKAAAIDRFGGPEVLQTQTLPSPCQGGRGLIQIDTAGSGSGIRTCAKGSSKATPRASAHHRQRWRRDGCRRGATPSPRFKAGDRVYAFTMKGGFYAEYVWGEGRRRSHHTTRTQDRGPALSGGWHHGPTRIGRSARTARRPNLLVLEPAGGSGTSPSSLRNVLAPTCGGRIRADGVELVRRWGADIGRGWSAR